MKDYISLFENGECLYENQNYEKALETFKKLYILNPSNTNANYIACCYIGLGEFDKAEKLLISLANTSHWETVHYNLARVYMAQKNFDDAFNCLGEAIEINPENSDCFFYLGVFYEKIKDYKKAINNYKHAVQLSDNSQDISIYFNNIGLCYYKMDDNDNALQYYKLSLDMDKNNDDAKYNMNLIVNPAGGKNHE